MMYPFLTLDDNTEIVHSDMRPDGTVKVYLERPDAQLGFRHATCILPSYTWEDIVGFSQAEIDRYQEADLPAIILIPGISGNTGRGIRSVKRSVEQAVGSDIIFQNDSET